MIHASLFSGIGGFDLAASWMGWENAFNCEIDEFCTKVLKYQFPNTIHYDDIKNETFTNWGGQIDILTGGFPCQPFSLAGKRKGAQDDRYLWPQMLRAIREIHPTWVVGENVGGIRSMVQQGSTSTLESETTLFGESYEIQETNQEYVIETVCKDLEREGYSVQPMLIPACSVGAPHRRDRIWFIANRNNIGQQCSIDGTSKREIHESKNEVKQSGAKLRNPIKTVVRCQLATDTIGNRCESFGKSGESKKEKRIIPQPDKRRKQTERIDGLSSIQRAIINSRCSRRDEGELLDGFAEKSQQGKCREEQFSGADFSCGRWRNFPTEPPVCGRDDGLSYELDAITFPKWREKSIKAYGNAIVPQVAFEIFKVIDKINNINNAKNI